MFRTDASFAARVLVPRPAPADTATRRLVAALRDAGVEVILAAPKSGLRSLAAAAVAEGVDVIALPLAAEDARAPCEQLREELEHQGAPYLPVIGWGDVPRQDWPELAELGVRRVFATATPPSEVVAFLSWLVEPKAYAAATEAHV